MDLSVASLVSLVWARRLVFLAVFAATALVGLGVTLSLRSLYQSETLLVLNEGRPSQQQQLFSEVLRYRINSLTYVIESEDVLKQAVSQVGHSKLFPRGGDVSDNEAALDKSIRALRKRLKVVAERDSQILRLTFRHENPAVAQEFLNSVVDMFLARQSEIYGNSEAPAFFRRQAERYDAEYQQASNKLAEFAKQHATFDIRQEIGLSLSRRDGVLASLATTQGSIAEKEAQAANIQNTLAKLRTRISLPSEITGPKPKVSQSEIDALTRDQIPSNESPLLLVRVFQESAQTLVNLNASIVGLRALKQSQEQALESIEAKLVTLSSIESEFERLKSEVEQTSGALQAHLKRAREAELNVDWDASERLKSIRVLQAATLPSTPVFPPKTIFMLVFLVAGAVAGTAVCVGLGMLRPSIIRKVSEAGKKSAVSDNILDALSALSASTAPNAKSHPSKGSKATFEEAFPLEDIAGARGSSSPDSELERPLWRKHSQGGG